MQSLLHNAACKVISHLLSLKVNHWFRKIDLCISNCLLYSLIFFLSLSFVLFTLFDLSLYFCSVSIKCLSLLGNVRCELIIYFRKLFGSDCMYCTFEYSIFSF